MAQKAGLSKAAKSKQPMTTQQKILAAQAKQRAKDGSKAPAKRKADQDGKKEGVKRAKVKAPGTMSVLMSQESSCRQYNKIDDKPAVMTRLTKRAERWRIKHPGLIAAACHGKSGKVFRIMDLPKEIRTQIWRMVVVHPEVFVWPSEPVGQEQPDLAMVSRQVRTEVLPIFYGCNTFGIELSPPRQPKPKAGRRAAMTPLVALGRWTCAIEGQSLRKIRHWAFECTPLDSGVGTTGHDCSAVVSLCFTHNVNDPVSTISRPIVEIHRDAACLLPGMSGYGMCVVQKLPEWLNTAVTGCFGEAGPPVVSGDVMVKLAKAIKARVEDLSGHRCERVVRSVESTHRPGGKA